MRWLRLYDDAINDPKILKLPEAMRWQWVAMLCVASKNQGSLPPLDDIAIQLRMTNAKAAEIITILVKAKLLDKTETGFEPHNWNGRQYKSDVSTERVKRFRKRERNVSPDVSSTVTETPPDAETDTEQKQSRAAAVSNSERVLRTDLAEILGPKISDLSRTAIWLSKGYSSTMILEAVREVIARGTSVASLSYFDAILAEKEANRTLTPSERLQAEGKVDMDKAAAMFAKSGYWSKYAGPEPGQTGCKCPPEILSKYGIAPPKLQRMNA